MSGVLSVLFRLTTILGPSLSYDLLEISSNPSKHFNDSTLCFRQGNDNINNGSLLLEWNFLLEDKHNKYHQLTGNNNCGSNLLVLWLCSLTSIKEEN